MRKNVHLPVLDQIRISEYQTYTSEKNGGVLEHDFVDGINLVVGVNGLGKTTLLRVIHRILSGPFDLRTPEELGQAQREVVPVRGGVAHLFGNRVPDGAKNASARLIFRIGQKKVSITRRLDNLKIQELLVNGQAILSQGLDTENQYQNWFTEVSGFGSFFDVLLSLRYLIFFFEDRRSIVWDENAQDELTRLFLYPTEDANLYRASFNLAQQADSLARNYQNILSKEKKALAKAELAAGDGTSNHAQDLRLHKSLSERLAQAQNQLEEYEVEHRAQLQRQLNCESELLDLQEKISIAREGVLSELFPSLEDYGAVLMSRMQTEHLCIVCGSEESDRINSAIDAWSKKRECPCCSTPIVKPNRHSQSNKSTQSAKELDRLHAKRLQLRSTLDEAREQVKSIYEKLAKQSSELAQIRVDFEPVRLRVDAVKQRTTSTPSLERIENLDGGMKAAQADRERNLKILRATSEKHERETKKVIDSIATEFNDIIGQLLAEKCELSASITDLRIGEGETSLRVLAPRFVPMMTSATSPVVTIPRRAPDAVSESQRDLIDFAFRLAFLRVTASKHAVSILIDTPESSLDSVFIPKFAKLLIGEGGRAGQAARRFIVTANLTGSPMISKLLNKSGTRRLTTAQQQHVLYLINETAASASVRRHFKDYQKDFDRAIQGK